jgi:hypothetical protein
MAETPLPRAGTIYGYVQLLIAMIALTPTTITVSN